MPELRIDVSMVSGRRIDLRTRSILDGKSYEPARDLQTNYNDDNNNYDSNNILNYIVIMYS